MAEILCGKKQNLVHWKSRFKIQDHSHDVNPSKILYLQSMLRIRELEADISTLLPFITETKPTGP